MKKLLLIIIFLLVSGLIYAEEYDYGDTNDDGGDSYGSEENSYGNENDSSYSDSDEARDLLGEEPVEIEETKAEKPETPKNPNVPGEVHKWLLAINTSFVHINHCTTINLTQTSFGLPFSTTNLAAGYQISSQIWLMAKFHLFANFVNGNGNAEFLLGPGIRADFIRTDAISFFGGAFISIGSTGKAFLFSPEIYAGVEYNLNKYLAIGVITEFAYILGVNKGSIHTIDFMLGPQLTIYF